MTLKLIQIGNSKGLRLPKTLIEQCGLESEVVVEVKDQTLMIYAAKDKRLHWEAAFKQMHLNEEDTLLDENQTINDWDEEEWQW